MIKSLIICAVGYITGFITAALLNASKDKED